MQPAVAARFAPQIAYLDHYADDADSRFAAFRGTRVAVLGDGPVARWCALSLIRNGCASVAVEAALAEGPATAAEFAELRAEAAEFTTQGSPAEVTVLPEAGTGSAGGWTAYEGYDVVVAACGRDAFRTSIALLGHGVPDGRLLLPAWTFGERAVVGPVSGRTPTAVWPARRCASARRGRGGRGRPLERSGPGGAPGPGPRGPLAAMLGNLLGYEVFRLVTKALPAETRGQVLLQDMASFDVLAERLLPHPRCPFCRTRPSAPEPVDLTTAPERPAFEPVVAAAPDDDATEGPLAELDRRSLALRPSVGVFTRYADEPVTQTPLKVGAVEVPLGAAGTRTVVAFDVQHTAGARLRALDAAAEVYAEHVVPASPAPDDTSGADALPRVNPDALTTATGAGAIRSPPGPGRVAADQGTDAGAWRGAALRAGQPGPSVRAVPCRGQRGRRPAGGRGGRPAVRARPRRAAASRARGRADRGDPPAVFADDVEATFLLRSAGHLGLDVELLDLGEADRTGVSVVLARSLAEGGGAGRWTTGSALDRTAAATDALRDLLGTVQLAAEGMLGAPDTGDPLLADLDAALIPVTAEDGAAGPDAGGPGDLDGGPGAAGRRRT
ncbi:TOMM precursor leader peptide-binding protein [Streptomyces sp. INA 01156]